MLELLTNRARALLCIAQDPGTSSDRESGVRRHCILSTAQMGLPARDGSRLGRGSRLGWRHGLGWGHGLGWHRFRQLFLSLALRTHLHRYPFTVDSAMAGPRPLGATV